MDLTIKDTCTVEKTRCITVCESVGEESIMITCRVANNSHFVTMKQEHVICGVMA